MVGERVGVMLRANSLKALLQKTPSFFEKGEDGAVVAARMAADTHAVSGCACARLMPQVARSSAEAAVTGFKSIAEFVVGVGALLWTSPMLTVRRRVGCRGFTGRRLLPSARTR